jgi:pimeloyl-ACP methyl ester carboxylesterase
MCDARLWREVEPRLRHAGHEVLHADLSVADSIEDMAAQAIACVADTCIPVGFSLGGIVALEIARSSPERLAGLVLADTNAFADLPERASARLRQQAAVAAGELARVVAEELKPNYLAPANRGRRDILDLTMAMALDLGPGVFKRQSEALRLRRDARAGLPGIVCQTLLLCGEDDPLCPPAWHLDMARQIPSATCRVIAEAGHLLPLEQPERFSSAILAWLGEMTKGSTCTPALTGS